MADGDYDCSYRPPLDNFLKPCSDKNPHFLIRKLVSLMDNPMSKHQVDRHITLLYDFLSTCTYAFWVHDLPFVLRLNEILAERYELVPAYRKPLHYLLAVCATPPMMMKTSEVFHCTRDVQEMFTLLGFSLFSKYGDEIKERGELENLCVHAIKCLLERKCPVGICCVPLSLIHKAVEDSELPVILATILERCDEEFYKKILNLTVLVVKFSSKCCLKMIKEKIIDTIIQRMLVSWETRDSAQLQLPELPDEYNLDKITNFQDTCSVLWKLLQAYENSPEEFRQLYKGPSQNTLWCFRIVFRILVRLRTSKKDRNNVMMILVYFLKVFPKMNFRGSGFPDDLCLLCGASELGTGGTWASEIRLTKDNMDYEFKKMLLIGIYYCIEYKVEIAIRNRKVTAALLRLIIPKMTIKWNEQHYCKLNAMALDLLSEVAALLPQEFLLNNGVDRVAMLLGMYTDGGYDTYLLQNTLKLVHKVLNIKCPKIIEGFQKLETIQTITNICKTLLNHNFVTLTQNCFEYAFSALEILVDKKDKHYPKAVKLCIYYMTRYLRPKPNDIVLNPMSLICCMDFLWELLIYCDENLYYFIQHGGIYILLDIIHESSFPIKVVALGLIVDACEEGTCIPHLVTWRSDGKTFIPMLLNLFRQENIRLDVKVTPEHVIKDLENPLMGRKQFEATYANDKDPNSSPSLMDMLGSCRPKVYAILQLFERHKERVEISNEKYLISNNNYCVTDEITLLIAENFLPLKLGEVWSELFRDFQKIQVLPVGIDLKIMDTILRRVHKWSLHIRNSQEHLLKKDKFEEHSLEKKFYHFLKESKLQEALDCLHELKYIARTTESMFRFMKKMRQRMNLDVDQGHGDELGEYHNTFMYDINVTPVFNQKVKIESNKIIDPFAKPFDLELVSPKDEVVETLLPECDNTNSTESLI